jgi:GMP synthase (glutamine-hydrolysing)
MSERWWVIQNVAIEGAGLLEEEFARGGLERDVIPAWDGARVPASPDGAAAIVILGGPMGVYERDRYAFIDPEIRLARRAVETGTPILGICLGSQILAEACGGRVYPGPVAELGWAPVTLSPEGRKDPLLGRLGSSFDVFHWHGDTFDLPPSAVHLAATPRYRNQAFRVGPRAYGFQFHVEFTPAIIEAILTDGGNKRWMKERGEGVTAEAIRADTRSLAGSSADRARVILRRFLALARDPSGGSL